MHYYQFNIGDYASHTRHLSMMEDLIYRRLLDWYYLNEKPIPSDHLQAARLIQAKDHFPDVECILKEFFTPTDQGWINKRADVEIAHFKAKSEQASKAGKASAQARFNVRSTDVQPNINHKPITIKQETDKPTTRKSSLDKLLERGVDDEIARDWLIIRKAKKLPLTDTAIKQVENEAKIAGLSFADAVAVAVRNTWAGYKAKWPDESSSGKKTTYNQESFMKSIGANK